MMKFKEWLDWKKNWPVFILLILFISALWWWLEQGGFHIPQSADGRIELSSRELAAILSGIKPQRYYKRYSKKS